MGLDAVVVSTPPKTHYKFAKDCLMHGLHVLVEKPLTQNSRDAEELIQIADDRRLTLMVGHTFEYNSAVVAMKKYIERKELGDLYYIDAARLNLGLFQREFKRALGFGSSRYLDPALSPRRKPNLRKCSRDAVCDSRCL